MILIPGLASSGETWDSTVAHYRDRYECHVLTVAGFTGVPRVASPMLDKVLEGVVEYAAKNHLEKPVIVGHSLGGFLALAIAVKYPGLPSRLVIVDAYSSFIRIFGSDMSPQFVKESVEQMKKYYGSMSQETWEKSAKSGASVRAMVTKDSDLRRLIGWSLASDRTAVADAMYELYAADLRDDLARIKAPALVFGTWIGYSDYTDRAKTEANLRGQYAKLAGVEIQMTDTARHFIMWDDPDWMFGHMDRFLGAR